MSYATDLRATLLESLIGFLTQPERGLVVGMVFGDTGALDVSLKQALKITGLQHVVSASGFNVGLVLAAIRPLAPRIPNQFFKFLLQTSLIWSYVLIAGAGASLVRAGVMASLAVVASALGRQYRAGYALILTVVLLCLVIPDYRTSLSFQLSVAATAGVIWVAPLIQGKSGWLRSLESMEVLSLEKIMGPSESKSLFSRLTSPVKEAFQVTLAAQLTTWPLIAWQIGELSWLSLIVNPLVLWLTPLITVGGAVLVSLTFSCQVGVAPFCFVARVLSLGVGVLAQVFILTVLYFGQFEWGVVKIPVPFTFPVAISWWVWLFLIVKLSPFSSRRSK